MMQFAWPWMLVFLPLPWLVARVVPAASPQAGAVFLPFAAAVSVDTALELRAPSRWRVALFTLVWLLLVAAATRPQWLDEPLPVATSARQLMMAVDTSGSMQTEDMAGGATRLQVVQAVGSEFLSHRVGDQVGLILFGTRPYLQAPLTTDLNTVGQFLREGMIGVAGPETAIGDTIGLAIKRLKAQREQTGNQGEMVLILLTDGGNNAGLMDPIEAAKYAAQEGLRIYTIGVGASAEMGMSGPGGNTDLDEGALKSIAQITHGAYFRATDAASLNQVYAEIDKLEPARAKEQWYRPTTEWFAWPLAFALLLSVATVCLRRQL
ncbi:MAG: VWA domain-containing protein [Casimicrobium sp.]|jgi:Ca-activated chloride channel family protein